MNIKIQLYYKQISNSVEMKSSKLELITMRKYQSL